MDTNGAAPSFEIPKSPERLPVIDNHNDVGAYEHASNPEILPAPPAEGSSVLPLHSLPIGSNPPQQAVIVQPTTQTALADDAHIIADDVDVIEKEWVERAKKIVSLTSNDPFEEAKELGKLKVTYMKKRFNKDMPVVVEKAK
jgi:hypothetical protein